MSGHSKWHNIQGKKGKQDKLRSNIFTKMTRAITVAAQQGGGDPEMNFTLRLAIERSKAVNLPKDNIERAIKRGTGELKDALTLHEATYEGFGPNGIAFLVETVSDNTNRTLGEVKNLFSRHGGSLGSPGSVQWQFARYGVIRIVKEQIEKIKDKIEEFELALIEAGADDLIVGEFGTEIRCQAEKFKSIVESVKKYNLEIEDSGLEWIAKEHIKLDEEKSQRVANLFEALEDLDDVRGVYTNEA